MGRGALRQLEFKLEDLCMTCYKFKSSGEVSDGECLKCEVEEHFEMISFEAAGIRSVTFEGRVYG